MLLPRFRESLHRAAPSFPCRGLFANGRRIAAGPARSNSDPSAGRCRACRESPANNPTPCRSPSWCTPSRQEREVAGHRRHHHWYHHRWLAWSFLAEVTRNCWDRPSWAAARRHFAGRCRWANLGRAACPLCRWGRWEVCRGVDRSGLCHRGHRSHSCRRDRFRAHCRVVCPVHFRRRPLLSPVCHQRVTGKHRMVDPAAAESRRFRPICGRGHSDQQIAQSLVCHQDLASHQGRRCCRGPLFLRAAWFRQGRPSSRRLVVCRWHLDPPSTDRSRTECLRLFLNRGLRLWAWWHPEDPYRWDRIPLFLGMPVGRQSDRPTCRCSRRWVAGLSIRGRPRSLADQRSRCWSGACFGFSPGWGRFPACSCCCFSR